MNIVVGLGNPGEEYEQTRHNVGFMVVDEIIKQVGWRWHPWRKHQALESYPSRVKHLFVKPQLFMNRSGETIQALQEEYPSRLETFLSKLITIHDDLDLPLGTIRIRFGGSSAGHNGVQSIIDALGSDQFWRIRVGIGKPEKLKLKNENQIKDYVLSAFDENEQLIVRAVIEQTAQKVLSNLETGSIVGETFRVG